MWGRAKKSLSAVGPALANGGYAGVGGHFFRNGSQTRLGVGAGDVAYIPGVTLPLFDFKGPGLVPTYHWMMTQTPQVWQGLNVPAIGLPGVINGSAAMQRLIDMRGVNGL